MSGTAASLPREPKVSVIVPTLCSSARAPQLRKVIDSIVSQTGVTVEAIIVVNGDRFDPALVETLRQDRRLQVLQRAEGNVSAARYAGLGAMTGDYFCFLDDDDEFLPGALGWRAALFGADPSADIAVTNGYINEAGKDELLVAPGTAREIQQDPCTSFFRVNWFASPAALFRSASVDAAVFDMSLKYFEWTYLFFLLLSRGKRFAFDEAPTYRKYEGSPSSVSVSIEYARAYPEFLLALMELPLPLPIRRKIRDKYVSSLNSRALLEAAQGSVGEAWRWHVRCLGAGGWRYMPATLHLLTTTLGTWRHRLLA